MGDARGNGTENQNKLFSKMELDLDKQGLFDDIDCDGSKLLPVIEDALYELSPPYRVSIYLSDVEHMSPQSINKVLRFSISEIKFMIEGPRLYVVKRISEYMNETIK